MPRYTILPAEKADLPRMNEISRDCFLDDSHTLFKVHEKGDPDNSKELAGDHLIPLLDNPNAKIIKVVDEETGFLAGWSAWYFFNYDGSRTVSRSFYDHRKFVAHAYAYRETKRINATANRASWTNLAHPLMPLPTSTSVTSPANTCSSCKSSSAPSTSRPCSSSVYR